ncbi:hypothetical protein INR49_013962 [Caranx melampygus]|nr:hypothetical protein INR49_013962 [Caranx melampygus]
MKDDTKRQTERSGRGSEPTSDKKRIHQVDFTLEEKTLMCIVVCVLKEAAAAESEEFEVSAKSAAHRQFSLSVPLYTPKIARSNKE